MRHNLILAPVLLFASLLPAQDAAPDAKATPDMKDLLVQHDGVVAKVNEEIIIGNEVFKKVEAQWKIIEENPNIPQDQLIKKKTDLWWKALREIVEDKVMNDAAKKEGIKVSDKEVEKELESQIKKEGAKKRLQDKLAQLGITMDQYREQVRSELIQRELILAKLGFRQKRVDPNTKMPLDSFVTPREVQEYYIEHKKDFYEPEKVKSRQIVIPFDAQSKTEKKAEAEAVLKQIQQGADMGLLALWYSKVKQGEGGLWGFAERGQFLSKEVDEALFKLKKGELGPVIEAKDCFVVLRCEGRTEAKQRTLGEDDVQDDIRRIIQNQKVNDNVDIVKKQLVKEAYIEPPDLFENPGR